MFKKLSLLIFIGLLAFGTMFFSSSVFAGDYGLTQTARSAGLPLQRDLPTLVGNIIGQALSLVAVLFFVLMVYGGFLWMTARGKEDQVKKAYSTIIAAVIGILIVLASFALTQFVFRAVQSGGAAPTPVPQNSGTEEQACGPGSEQECSGVNIGGACSYEANGENFEGTCSVIGGDQESGNCSCE